MATSSLLLPTPEFPSLQKSKNFRPLHILITRFAIELRAFEKLRADPSPAAFDKWIRERTSIFKQICLPSIVKQTSLPFRWMLGVSRAREAAFLSHFEGLCPQDWIRLIWQEKTETGYESHVSSFIREITQILGEHDAFSHVITTRIDNDDALHQSHLTCASSFAETVLARHPELDDFWISFPFGAQLCRNQITIYQYPNNPFLSRVESVDAFKSKATSTAFFGNHFRIFKRAKVFCALTKKPMWLQYIHQGNLLNRLNEQSYNISISDNVLSDFGDPRELLE